MASADLIEQVFLRYYELPTDFDREPQIAAIKIVGVDERNENGEVIRYKTIALRDDRRPKRVGDKIRTISLAALTANWVETTQDIALSDKEVYNNSIAIARDLLISSVEISKPQAEAIVTLIAEITSQSDKRKLNRAKAMVEKAQRNDKPSAAQVGMLTISSLIGH